MTIIAKLTNPGELLMINPAESNNLKEPLYVRDIEVKTFSCTTAGAKVLELSLHLVGKTALNFNPEYPWICADCYISTHPCTTQDGKTFLRTDLNARTIAPILNFNSLDTASPQPSEL